MQHSIAAAKQERVFMGFMAEDSASGKLIGRALASFLDVEAMLSPPWSTSQPLCSSRSTCLWRTA